MLKRALGKLLFSVGGFVFKTNHLFSSVLLTTAVARAVSETLSE